MLAQQCVPSAQLAVEQGAVSRPGSLGTAAPPCTRPAGLRALIPWGSPWSTQHRSAQDCQGPTHLAVLQPAPQTHTDMQRHRQTHRDTQTHTHTQRHTHTNIHRHTQTQTRTQTCTHTHTHAASTPTGRAARWLQPPLGGIPLGQLSVPWLQALSHRPEVLVSGLVPPPPPRGCIPGS